MKRSAISTSRWTMTPMATWMLWRQTAWVLAKSIVRIGGCSVQTAVWPPTRRTRSTKLRGKLVSIYYICFGFKWMKQKLIRVKDPLNSADTPCYLAEISLWLAKSVIGSWVHSDLTGPAHFLVCAPLGEFFTCSAQHLSPLSWNSPTQICQERGKKHHDLLLSSTHVAWVGSCGRGKCFFCKAWWLRKTCIRVGNRVQSVIPLGNDQPMAFKRFWLCWCCVPFYVQ